jgi:hypothetical protein
MAYYIFLKSLRRLEEFRKNPHVKIPPKSLLQISKALVNSKIQFLFEKNFSSEFSPLGLPTPLALACRAVGPSRPAPPRPKPPSPLGLSAARPARAFGVFYRSRFPLRFTPSRAGRFLPLSPPCGPRLSVSSSPPRRLTPVRIFPAPPLPRAAAPRLGCPRAFTTLLITPPS